MENLEVQEQEAETPEPQEQGVESLESQMRWRARGHKERESRALESQEEVDAQMDKGRRLQVRSVWKRLRRDYQKMRSGSEVEAREYGSLGTQNRNAGLSLETGSRVDGLANC